MCRVADGNQSRTSTVIELPEIPEVSAMEYRGIEYQVVQTANPTGWKWTVSMVGRQPRTGQGHSRAAAIGLAQLAIDKLLKASPDASASLEA
jgi:hypothetical protein